MGVFARLLRRSKATEEASTAEARTGTPAVGPVAEESVAVEPAGAMQQMGSAESQDSVVEAAAEAKEPVAEAAAETVDIPKQQSVEGAADREAGEGART